MFALPPPIPSQRQTQSRKQQTSENHVIPMPTQAAQLYLDEPTVPADPKRSELIPGEDLGRVCADHRLAHLAGGDPGPGVLVSPQDDLNHLRCVLGSGGQGHTGVIVGSHRQVEMSEALWPLHILELILVGRRDMDSLWKEERKRGVVGHLKAPASLWLSQQLQEA